MKYVLLLFLLVLLIYLFSFAVYNWKNKNKLGAVGVAVLGIMAVTLATVVIFWGNYM